uniref:High mobility group protein B2 n=1 Tax=Callorhinchus milii TaxID=7868 RepID=K4G0B4_CALMI|nr:high mobility group box 1 [Callorhinchus milii]
MSDRRATTTEPAIKRKMARDPKKPRGRLTSHALFVQTCREEHKKKHPEKVVSFTEFSKKCSERWKTMSAKEKSKFEELSKEDKKRYESEMKDYVPPKGAKKQKKKKDPNAPKRPPSGFFIFSAHLRPKIREECPGLSIGDIAKKLGEKWNAMGSEEKLPYEQQADKLKEKYKKDVAAYRAKTKPDSVKNFTAKAEKSKKKAKEEEEDEDEDDEEEEDDEDDEDDDD